MPRNHLSQKLFSAYLIPGTRCKIIMNFFHDAFAAIKNLRENFRTKMSPGPCLQGLPVVILIFSRYLHD